MTRYDDIFDGLFALIATNNPTDYEQIFGSVDPTKLDTYACTMYGSRIVLPVYARDSETGVQIARTRASIIFELNAYNWIKLATAARTEYDIANPITSTEMVTRQATASTEKAATKTDKLHPFNSDALATDKQSTDSGDELRTDNSTETRTHKGDTLARVKESINFEKNNNYICDIVKEFTNLLTTAIY